MFFTTVMPVFRDIVNCIIAWYLVWPGVHCCRWTRAGHEENHFQTQVSSPCAPSKTVPSLPFILFVIRQKPLHLLVACITILRQQWVIDLYKEKKTFVERKGNQSAKRIRGRHCLLYRGLEACFRQEKKLADFHLMMRNLFVAGSLVDPKLLRVVVGQWSRAVVVGHAASRMLWLIFLRHSMRISCLPASSCLTAPHHFIVVLSLCWSLLHPSFIYIYNVDVRFIYLSWPLILYQDTVVSISYQ